MTRRCAGGRGMPGGVGITLALIALSAVVASAQPARIVRVGGLLAGPAPAPGALQD